MLTPCFYIGYYVLLNLPIYRFYTLNMLLQSSTACFMISVIPSSEHLAMSITTQPTYLSI